MKDDFLDLFDTPKKGKKRSHKCLSGIRGGKDNFTKKDIAKYCSERSEEHTSELQSR